MALVATGIAGCGSGSSTPPTAAERLVMQKIRRELQHAPPRLRAAALGRSGFFNPNVFVYCDPPDSTAKLCSGTVTAATSQEVVAQQRWRVETNVLGTRVLSARPLDRDLIARGSAVRPRHKPSSGNRLASLSLETTTDPVYACIANADGKRIFQGVLGKGRKIEVRARKLLLDLGNALAVVHINHEIYRIPASPYGLKISPARISYLPKKKRPCPPTRHGH